jgi:hypothetical protein
MLLVMIHLMVLYYMLHVIHIVPSSIVPWYDPYYSESILWPMPQWYDHIVVHSTVYYDSMHSNGIMIRQSAIITIDIVPHDIVIPHYQYMNGCYYYIVYCITYCSIDTCYNCTIDSGLPDGRQSVRSFSEKKLKGRNNCYQAPCF